MAILSMLKGKASFGKGNNNQKFPGYCDSCGKYGHEKSDCWSKEQQGKGKGQSKATKTLWERLGITTRAKEKD